MAEGMTRLNQQVVDIEYWNRSEQCGESVRPSSLAAGRGPRVDQVRRAVEADIIPRVLLSRAQEPDTSHGVAGGDLGISQSDVLHFVKRVLDYGQEAAVSADILAMQSRGTSIDRIFLDLFQPAARHIGELWADDLCTFVDVTLAIGTMHKLLRLLAPEFHKNGRPVSGTRQALLVPLPGDQHTFGLAMVNEFFRRAGWSVWSMPLASLAELGQAVQRSWFTVVGFSVGGAERLDELTNAIALVRRQSCNSAVGVMVGGPLFVDRPDLAARVGADAMGGDANEALALAESFAAPATEA